MSQTKPLVVLLSFRSHAAFAEFYPSLLDALHRKAEVQVAHTRAEALRYLTSTARPRAVIVCSATPSYPEYVDVSIRLEQYARAGGTVVFAGLFAASVGFPDLKAMFKNVWGLPWEMSRCDDKTYALNLGVKGLDVASLQRKFWASAILLRGVKPHDALYVGQNVLKKIVAGDAGNRAAPDSVEAAVTFTVVGKGCMGYIGDRAHGYGPATTSAILAMCFRPGFQQMVPAGTVTPVEMPTPDMERRPSVLVISLDDFQLENLDAPLYRALRRNAWVTQVTRARDATAVLATHPLPSAVLVTDGSITGPQHAKLLSRLVTYARAGSRVVFGLQFSNTVRFQDVPDFFAQWGFRGWERGAYRGGAYILNPAGIPQPLSEEALFPTTSMKANLFRGVPREYAVYVPDPADGYGESAVGRETPAVFAPVGNGWFGYVGDVNNEQASLRLLIEMLGVKIKPGDMGPRNMVIWSPSEGKKRTMEEEIPLPPPQTPHRPREAEVEARRRQREAKRQQKESQGERFADEANAHLGRREWLQAADKYLSAALIAGPKPQYLSKLAKALVELHLWELADSAASRALMQEPDLVDALYARALARKGAERFGSAKADFLRVLELDSNHERAGSEAEDLGEGVDPSQFDWPEDEEDEEEPLEVEEESDSEDFRHVGNGKPCKDYNHGGCARGRQCRASHAPDEKSARDDLGRNVCLYWLLGQCRFGDGRCAYAHDRTYLPQGGWWTKTRRLARMYQAFDDAVAAAPRVGVSEGILAEALKPASWRKDLWAGGDYAEQAKLRRERERADSGADDFW
ncbi:hypothetical protein C8Q77DRAFT_157668 [Trametes polyzona]|nr:hypothetical protein C8Q77DRAFT_157668 [Trametes polyzona]